jgi:hypothetical protein
VKFECPHCKKLGQPTDFRVEEGEARWTCPECGREVELTPDGEEKEPTEGKPREPSAERDEEAPSRAEKSGARRCPKCGALRADRVDCPRCGLVYDRWDPARYEIPSDPVLDPLWQEAEKHDEPDKHEAFVAAAQGRGRLDIAAARYAERLRMRTDDQESVRRLAQITASVQAQGLRSESKAKKRSRSRSRNTRRALMALILLLLGVLVYLLFSDALEPSRSPRRESRDEPAGPGSSPVNLKKEKMPGS